MNPHFLIELNRVWLKFMENGQFHVAWRIRGLSKPTLCPTWIIPVCLQRARFPSITKAKNLSSLWNWLLKKIPTIPFASSIDLDWLIGIKSIFLLRGKIPSQAEKAHIKFQLDSFQNHHENCDIFFAPQWVSHGNSAWISATMITVMRACSVPPKT